MPSYSPQQVLNLAIEYHRLRRFADAEMLYRQVLAQYPGNMEIVQALGVVAYDQGRYPEALELIQQAIRAQPGVADYYNNLGLALAGCDRLTESAAAFETALQLEPNNAACHYNLGNTRRRQQFYEAAIASWRTAVQLHSRHTRAWLNLGSTLQDLGRLDEALSAVQSALAASPGDPVVLNNLGNTLQHMGRLDEALVAFQSALAGSPRDPVALNNLGVTLQELGRLDEVLAPFQSALEASPGDPLVLSNLAGLYKERGEVKEAITLLRQSVATRPDPVVHSNLILTLHYDASHPPEAISDEQQRWNTHFALPSRRQPLPPHTGPSADRRLRIGYVSADLRSHVVGRTFLPIFEAHDRTQVECICYASSAADAVAQRFRTRTDRWHSTEHWSDEQFDAQIRADGIDILIDLSLHTGGNRLPVFARQPAPIQVSWLGYPGSSGVEAMDYWLTDRFLEPPETNPSRTGPQPFHLPDAWCCYPAPEVSPEVGELPATRAGHITFGSFNNFAKINERVLDLWARILSAVPGSRLLLLAKLGSHRDHVRTFLQQRGIAPERCAFLAYEPQSPDRTDGDFLRRYAQIDIALDPFPYNGMTTTGDALWMGVPVVALRGTTAISRASFSLLAHLGLSDLVAGDEESYLQLAVSLATDLARLTELRATLRERMKSSPLLDAPLFARHLEAAYRTMWQRQGATSTAKQVEGFARGAVAAETDAN